ncbi:MAG: hypothetical protein LBT93_02455 [Treponema sp.]|jgi:hypothetical protein|nr:hypothetical protein [Treponema sp.]
MDKTKIAGICLLGGLLLSTALAALNLGGGGAPPDGSPETSRESETVEVSGRVRLVGSGIQPEVVISAENGEWYITRNEQNQFLKLQQQWVKVEGKADFRKIILADGTYLETRRILRDIRLFGPDTPPNPTKLDPQNFE